MSLLDTLARFCDIVVMPRRKRSASDAINDMAAERDGHDLFLCHSSRDKEFVRRLASDLAELSITVWLDEWELAPGDSLHERIGSALRKAKYVVVVLSPDSINSRWCQDELRESLTREKQIGSKVVVPILSRDVEVPSFLGDKLRLNFSREYYEPLARLAGMILRADSRILSRAVAQKNPVSLGDVRQLLVHAGVSPTIVISTELFDSLAKLIKLTGNSVRVIDDDDRLHMMS